MKFFFILLILVVILSIPLGVVAAEDAEKPINLNIKNYPQFPGTANIDTVEGQNPTNIIIWLYIFGISLSGLAAFLMLVWAGIEWMTSSGVPARIDTAKDRIRKALYGVLLILSSFIILGVINPDLLSLKWPELDLTRQTETQETAPLVWCINSLSINDQQDAIWVLDDEELNLSWPVISATTECEGKITNSPEFGTTGNIWLAKDHGSDTEKTHQPLQEHAIFNLTCGTKPLSDTNIICVDHVFVSPGPVLTNPVDLITSFSVSLVPGNQYIASWDIIPGLWICKGSGPFGFSSGFDQHRLQGQMLGSLPGFLESDNVFTLTCTDEEGTIDVKSTTVHISTF